RFFPKVRYWRLITDHRPEGLFRKILARLMLKEIDYLGAWNKCLWPVPAPHLPTVFFDPLYVLRAPLQRDDIVLCHDVGPISHADLFDASTTRNYQLAYEKIKNVRPGMLFVSEASKLEFQKLYGKDYRFLHAIPLYARPAAQTGEQAPVEGIASPFLLTVAALEKRKNYQR